VVILDRNEPGSGCSAGNAGWIVPSFSIPLPSPGITSKALLLMLRQDSAFHLSLRATPRFASWLWQFWRHCNESDFLRGLQALGRLNASTCAAYDSLICDGVEFEQHRQGVLFACLEEKELQRLRSRLTMLAEFGHETPETLRGAQLRSAEPLLKRDVVGALYVHGDRHVRPETLTRGLLQSLRRAGTDLRSGVDVLNWEVRDDRIVAIHTTRGRLVADHFVLAAGSDSDVLGRKLDLTLALQAGKGYSITFESVAAGLRQPVDLVEAGVVCSPFATGWRIAGTMELSGADRRSKPRRIEVLRRTVCRYLQLDPTAVNGGQGWMGQRPLTPDGLPTIGRMPRYSNGYVAVGHGMLGITLAPVTGALIADWIIRGRTNIDASAFDPCRFTQ
jgi:D-amino-acid dehydrogenase